MTLRDKVKDVEHPISSDELASLEPTTVKEHLMVLTLGQVGALKRIETIEQCLGKNGLVDRVSRLETTWKVGGILILSSIMALAAKAIFG